RALGHGRAPEQWIGGKRRRAAEAAFEHPPRGREQAALVDTDTPAEHAEIAEDFHERVRRTRHRRGGPVTDFLADRAGIVGVLEEELAVAGEVIRVDAVGRDTRRVDERNDQARALAREDAVELEAAKQRMRD